MLLYSNCGRLSESVIFKTKKKKIKYGNVAGIFRAQPCGGVFFLYRFSFRSAVRFSRSRRRRNGYFFLGSIVVAYRPQVLGQASAPGEARAALVAEKRFLAGVHAPVPQQVSSAGKRAFAVLARERPFARVRAHVQLQRLVRLQPPSAERAQQRFSALFRAAAVVVVAAVGERRRRGRGRAAVRVVRSGRPVHRPLVFQHLVLSERLEMRVPRAAHVAQKRLFDRRTHRVEYFAVLQIARTVTESVAAQVALQERSVGSAAANRVPGVLLGRVSFQELGGRETVQANGTPNRTPDVAGVHAWPDRLLLLLLLLAHVVRRRRRFSGVVNGRLRGAGPIEGEKFLSQNGDP